MTEFPDGVWLVELAPVGDPAALGDAIATVLGITPQAGFAVSDSIARALSGRRVLMVLDNCEHLLDAAADVVETILANTDSVRIMTTSREGLRARAEHLWPVPSLDVRGGGSSAAVELFVERARAVHPGFDLTDSAETEAAVEICRRLDGICLAIELAAARMVSMSAGDVRNRLGDRFRLLSGSRRGLERHQTLRHAVAWSYDLLDDDERRLLNQCSVFADGFDLDAVTNISGDGLDEYAVLDLLDSLVRKSLVTIDRSGSRTRYGMLETIRQFAEEQMVAEFAGELRSRHASYFAAQAMAKWQLWDGPDQKAAIDWVDAEFANLRAGFRWAADNDSATAAAIAAHTTVLAYTLQRFEPVGWAEEILASPNATQLRQLPRLYIAACFCQYTGRVETALRYANEAVVLEGNPRYDSFEAGWSRIWQANAERFAGRVDRFVEICSDLALQPGIASAVATAMLLYIWPVVGPAEAAKARAIADETLRAVRSHGNPFCIALATIGYGRAFADTDPERALATFRKALAPIDLHRIDYVETLIVREAAGLEALHGEVDQALAWFDAAVDSFHRAGNLASLTPALAYLVAFFARIEQPEVAATVFGSIANPTRKSMAVDLPALADQLRTALGQNEFDRRVANGAAMDHAESVKYVRDAVARARMRLADTHDGHLMTSSD